MQTFAATDGPLSPVISFPKRPRHSAVSSPPTMPASETSLVAETECESTLLSSESHLPSLETSTQDPLLAACNDVKDKDSRVSFEDTSDMFDAPFTAGDLEGSCAEATASPDAHEEKLPQPGSELTKDASPAIESDMSPRVVPDAEPDLPDMNGQQSFPSSSETSLQSVHPSQELHMCISPNNSPASSSGEPCNFSASTSPFAPDPNCVRCQTISAENDRLHRLVARLRFRLYEARETAQTHGQRLLRAAFQDKIHEITNEHAQQTTEILNRQKACFEEELEAMEKESHAAINDLQVQLHHERFEKEHMKRVFQRERDAALEKTNAIMQAVQRKIAHLHAKATRLEREKANLSAAHTEKQVMVEVLASAAAARDADRQKRELLSKAEDEERNRKNKLIDSMQSEIKQLRARLEEETQRSKSLLDRIEAMHVERDDEKKRHAQDIADCKTQSQKDGDRLGRLFASVIQDYANVQSDVSTND